MTEKDAIIPRSIGCGVDEMMPAMQNEAIAYIKAGLSILPTRKDKNPAIKKWKSRMFNIPTVETVRNEFNNGVCIAIVAGKVSGNVECIDFDFEGKLFTDWMNAVDGEDSGLVDKLVIQQTQSGGCHVVYRCAEPVEGNQKLAGEGIEVQGPGEHEFEGKKLSAKKYNGKYFILPCFIKTRGEGGYFLCFPSGGYTLQQGKFSQLPVITAEQRDILLSAAKSLNRWIPEPRQDPAAGKRQQAGLSPGDDFNVRGDIPALLMKHGWTPTGRRCQDGEHWRRPGKNKGWSATLFNSGSLYVFSSNAAPFEADSSYYPLAIYTMLEHSGDYTAAVRELVRQGYGDNSDYPKNEVSADICTKNGTTTEKTQPKNLNEAIRGFCVPQKYVDCIGSEEFLIDNLVIKNHILTVIGESGAGKTAFFFFYGAKHMAEGGYIVHYVDADSPPSDHKKMMAFSDEHRFNWLIPDVNEGQSVETFKKMLVEMADRQESFENTVWIFDTLKKFVNTMSKDSIKTFYTLMRRLTKLGATVILLGHANKYRDGEGNLIFEGVNDVKSDSDELIFFSHQALGDNETDVTTMIDTSVGAKVRGLFKPFSFHINRYREVTFYDHIKTPIELSKTTFKASDGEILDVTEAYLPDGHLKIPHLWPGQNPPPEVSTHPQRQGKMSLQILD